MEIKIENYGKHSLADSLSAIAIAKELNMENIKQLCAVMVNDQVRDLAYIPKDGDQLRYLTFADQEGADAFHHSSSHIMAQAIKNLFPDTLFGIGPAIKDGFYYDLDSSHIFNEEDLQSIEKEMKKIVKANYKFEREEISRSEALKLFGDMGEIYKVELINDMPSDEIITIYRQGDFIDLCAGPHLLSTGMVKAFKLMSVAGAYWRGDSDKKMLQRIYATSFPTREELDAYLYQLEEAKRRDHRKLGQELELFLLMDEGPGFPFFLPKGMVLRNELERYWHQQHDAWNYQEIKTPLILNRELWRPRVIGIIIRTICILPK